MEEFEYIKLTIISRAGQMPLWSEQSSPENLDSIVWPRLASAAEVFWTGATLPDGTPRLGLYTFLSLYGVSG